MSRSHKHHYWINDHNRGMKGLANRAVRNVPIELTDSLQNGRYKRHFESWNISDWGFEGYTCRDRMDEREWRKWYYNK